MKQRVSARTAMLGVSRVGAPAGRAQRSSYRRLRAWAAWLGLGLGGLSLAVVPLVAAAAPTSTASPGVDAARAKQIANANACFGCHAVNRQLVGPSFAQIAAKYKGDPGASALLEKIVRHGGSGVWGVIPMPSHPGMSDADIQTVVTWILAGAPAD